MKIEFSRSGGIAGPAVGRSVEIDTNDLSATDANELAQLINKADLAKQRTPSTSRPVPDAFHYRITVSDKGQSHTIVTSDADMPEHVQPLIDWLIDWSERKG
ncbi:MAG TPA: protealysin inhibitor emfourin [Pyrinomonadaceae bacterium]